MSKWSYSAWLLPVLFFCLPSFVGCGQVAPAASERAKNLDSDLEEVTMEDRIKEKTLSDSFGVKASPLTTVQHIECKMGEGEPFVYPHSLTLSEEGWIYISDNNGHKIYSYSPRTRTIAELKSNTHQSHLNWPTQIKTKGKDLFVSDTDGIKIFRLDGSFVRLLRTYYQINDFIIRPEGGLILNPSFRQQKPSDPLIVEVDENGTKVQDFGARLNRREHMGLEDMAWLCFAGNRLFVVFRYRPVVRIFNFRGDLIRSFNINHAIFGELIDLGKDEKYTNPGPSKYRLPGLVAGACGIGDRLYVLVDLPRPEIIEYNLDGIETNRYQGNVSPVAMAYHGFDGDIVDDRYRFWILARSRSSLLTLWECSGSKAK